MKAKKETIFLFTDNVDLEDFLNTENVNIFLSEYSKEYILDHIKTHKDDNFSVKHKIIIKDEKIKKSLKNSFRKLKFEEIKDLEYFEEMEDITYFIYVKVDKKGELKYIDIDFSK